MVNFLNNEKVNYIFSLFIFIKKNENVNYLRKMKFANLFCVNAEPLRALHTILKLMFFALHGEPVYRMSGFRK